jgi:DNA polymerase
MIQRFNVCDLNAIETRVGAWLAGCGSLLKVFEPWTDSRGVYKPNGKCPYLSFGGHIHGKPFECLYEDYEGWNGKERKSDAKVIRQFAKPGVLGAIYRLSGGSWGWSKKSYKDHDLNCSAGETYQQQNGKIKKIGKKYCGCPERYDKIKTGLWGYAANMGIDITQEQSHMIVRTFRETYAEIPAFWQTLENATVEVMRGQDTVRRVGPGGCVTIDKVNITERHPMMRMRLPSGRYLHYLDARLESCKMPWKNRDTGEDVYRDALVYAGTNQDTKQWDIWVQTHGGKLFENLVQAIARDVLAVSLLKFDASDMPVCGHVHDEGIVLVPDDPFSPGVKDMVKIMSTPIDWAPGLLLGADGFEGSFYHK